MKDLVNLFEKIVYIDFKRVVKCKIAVVFLSEAVTKYLKSRSLIQNCNEESRSGRLHNDFK